MQCPEIDTTTLSDHARLVGPNFQIVSPGRLCGSVLRGRFHVKALRRGLFLHACDAVDLHDLVTRVVQKPGITVQVFLKGDVAATVGGKQLLPGRDGPDGDGGAPRALVTARTRREIFERRGWRGGHVRKVSITLSHDWLADSAAACRTLDRFTQEHLAQQAWTPSPRLVALAERILEVSPSSTPLSGLYLESLALEVVADALGTVADGLGDGGRGRVDPRDLRRLRRVEARLAEEQGALVSLDDLARDVGVSVSTLQRLFQAAHGMSAFEFVRHRKLEAARAALERDGVSVKEAAFRAGYSSAANFSTAYRKHFGRTPRQSRAS